MPRVGERVLGMWPIEVEWWYAGVIVAADGKRFEVQFDDGLRAELTPREMAPLEIAAGTRVQARWKGGPGYFPGVVAEVRGQAMHIEYDDGDNEWVSVGMIRVHEDDVPTPG